MRSSTTTSSCTWAYRVEIRGMHRIAQAGMRSDSIVVWQQHNREGYTGVAARRILPYASPTNKGVSTGGVNPQSWKQLDGRYEHLAVSCSPQPRIRCTSLRRHCSPERPALSSKPTRQHSTNEGAEYAFPAGCRCSRRHPCWLWQRADRCRSARNGCVNPIRHAHRSHSRYTSRDSCTRIVTGSVVSARMAHAQRSQLYPRRPDL